MFKLNDLIISGMEVYSVPQAPRPSMPVETGPVHPAEEAGSGRLLRNLLVHAMAIGALPLPWGDRRR